MNIFLTGTESFVGRNLIAACDKKGFKLTGLDVISPNDSRFIQLDLNDPQIVNAIPDGTDVVIHLAALSRDPDCKDKASECFETNVMGTLNLMAAAQRKNVKQFIFASSEWVYDDCTAEKAKTEDTPINISNHTSEYALSKLVSENNLRQKFQHGFCHTTILRFGIIYGPRPSNWSAVEALFFQVRDKEEITVGSLKTGRSFIHIDDIVSGIIASIGLKGFQTLNLQGERLITLNEIVETSQKIHKKTVKVSESNPQSPSVRMISGAKAMELIQFKPLISLEQGLRSLL